MGKERLNILEYVWTKHVASGFKYIGHESRGTIGEDY